MAAQQKVTILYFTDILCIWAYIAQARIDQLKNTFDSDVIIKNHFISVFGSVEQKIEQSWATKGGAAAYCKHVQEVALKFDHIDVHPDIWTKNRPTTSGGCHLFLKAIQILQERNELPIADNTGKSLVDIVAWEFRLAFFRDLVDISNYKAQMEIAKKLALPHHKIQTIIESGSAFSALDTDSQLKEKFQVVGSPSLIFNEGRQAIYGNVGYRVIEANVYELLNQPDNQASWC